MFEIFTDSSANLTDKMLKNDRVHIIPFHYSVNGIEKPCYSESEPFDGKYFYELMKNNEDVKTSMINTDTFIKAFEPFVGAGKSVLYIGISGGLSGTINAARIAADELKEKYPDAEIAVIDSLSGSLGEGLLVHYASMMRAGGKSLKEVERVIGGITFKLRSHFTPMDLKYIKRGGRISAATAIVGSALGIKPLIRSDNEGKIDMYDKVRGRRAALDRMIREISEDVDTKKRQIAAISHADCESDARYLADKIKKLPYISDVIVNMMEPVTGIHGGPGMIALFYIAETK